MPLGENLVRGEGAGQANPVSPAGVRFTEEHVALINRYVRMATPAQAYYMGIVSAMAVAADLEPTAFLFETMTLARNLGEAVARAEDWRQACLELRWERAQDGQRSQIPKPKPQRPADK
jgi:hypothetical protein